MRPLPAVQASRRRWIIRGLERELWMLPLISVVQLDVQLAASSTHCPLGSFTNRSIKNPPFACPRISRTYLELAGRRDVNRVSLAAMDDPLRRSAMSHASTQHLFLSFSTFQSYARNPLAPQHAVRPAPHVSEVSLALAILGRAVRTTRCDNTTSTPMPQKRGLRGWDIVPPPANPIVCV